MELVVVVSKIDEVRSKKEQGEGEKGNILPK